MVSNEVTAGAILRGEVLPALENTRDSFSDRLKRILFTQGFDREKDGGFGAKVDEYLKSDQKNDPENYKFVEDSIGYVRYLEVNRGTKIDDWPELTRTAERDQIEKLTEDEKILMLAVGMKAIAKRTLDNMLSSTGFGKMGEDGGIYSPDMQAQMQKLYEGKMQENATVDVANQTEIETKRRIHQYAVLRFTEKSRQGWGLVKEYLLNPSGTRADDNTGDLLEAMQKIGGVQEGRNAALNAEEAAGAVLRLGLEGDQVEALIQGYRMGVRLIIQKEDGSLSEKKVFFGTKEAYDHETGNTGRRILGTDERFLKPYKKEIERLYPELLRGEHLPKAGKTLSKDQIAQNETMLRFSVHPIYFSEQTYTTSDGKVINPGEPIFSFRLRDSDKEALLIDSTRKSMLTTDYKTRDEDGKLIKINEPVVPQRLNIGEKVRTMNYTDFKRDAAIEWVGEFLRDEGIDPKTIVAADTLYPSMSLFSIGGEAKKYGLFPDIGPMAIKKISIDSPDGTGTKIELEQHDHFIKFPTDEARSESLKINLFGARGGSFWGLAEGIKSASMEQARENPTLVAGGELVDQGATYSQLAFAYLRAYQIGELYSQVAGMNYYPGLGGRKFSNWAIYRAMQEKGGYRFKLYDNDGVTVLNNEPKVIDVDGTEIRIGKNKLGAIRWSGDDDNKIWQKAIHEYVFFAKRRFRLDNTDRIQAMSVVETARAGMKYAPGKNNIEKQKKVSEKLETMSGGALKQNIIDVIENRFSTMMEKRTRRESREISRLPGWALKRMSGANYKPYLVSVWRDPNKEKYLDSIEYKGILGLEAAIDEESIDKFEWQRTDLMKQAKYERTSEIAYKTAGMKLRTAMIQAKDPRVLELFGFGLKPMDAQDMNFKIVGGILSFLNKNLQLSQEATQEFGKQISEAIAEYNQSIPDRTSFGARDLSKDLLKLTLDMIDESAFFAAIELKQRERRDVNPDDSIAKAIIQEGSSPGVGAKPFNLKYAGNMDESDKDNKKKDIETDWADRISAQYLRRMGHRVVHPNGGFDEGVNKYGELEISEKFDLGEVMNLPVVVAGDGRLLDRTKSNFKASTNDWEWKTVSKDGKTTYVVDAGPALQEVYGHHKLGLLARKATTIMFFNNMMNDAGVMTTFDKLGMTNELITAFELYKSDYEKEERKYLDELEKTLKKP